MKCLRPRLIARHRMSRLCPARPSLGASLWIGDRHEPLTCNAFATAVPVAQVRVISGVCGRKDETWQRLLCRDGADCIQSRTKIVQRQRDLDMHGAPLLIELGGMAIATSPVEMLEDKTNAGTDLHVLIVDQNVMRACVLEDGLSAAGIERVTVLRDMQNLMRRIVEIDPEVILIDLETPSRDVLEQMFQVSRCVRRPIAMFVDQSDSEMIEAAVDAGVGAYVVDGLRKERVKAVLDMAVSRFNAFNKLREELDKARAALDERKLIERAKGFLMKERGMSEEAAYTLLRKAAMNENRRISDVAQSVVTASRLLK